MDVVMYSTNCPKCNVLEKKMRIKNIKYEVVTDLDVIENKRFMSMPMLEVDGKILDFRQAISWVDEQE